MNFKQKYGDYALITGGTSGIGEQFALQLAEKGLNIILVARRQNLLNEKSEVIRKKYKVEVKTIQADMTKMDDIQKVISETNHLEVGLLIPCAGLENHGLFPKIDIQKELAVIQLNIVAVMALTHHFTKKMLPRKRGGVLLVSSMIGHMPNPYFANYAGTKAYVLNFGNSLNGELKPYGIDVTVLSPGPTDTPMIADVGFDMKSTPMTVHHPSVTAKTGLDALGHKPYVVPGFKNSMMVTMSSITPTSMAINMGKKLIEKSIDPQFLK